MGLRHGADPENIDRIGEELGLASSVFGLENVGIRRWVKWCLHFRAGWQSAGWAVGPQGYWVACGVMAGFSQGGGVGKALAEWMIHGEPEQDIFGMDVARFGRHHSNKEYIRQTTAQFYSRRFVLTYPNEQLPAGRKLRVSGAHADMDAAGARWANSWGLEIPRYFAPKDFEEPGTMLRPASFRLWPKNAALLPKMSACSISPVLRAIAFRQGCQGLAGQPHRQQAAGSGSRQTCGHARRKRSPEG